MITQSRYPSRLSLLSALVLLLGLVLLLNACTSTTGNPGIPGAAAPQIPVMELASRPVVTHKEYPASVEGVSDIEIRARVDGYLEKIFVDEGDYVRKGQVLFRINDRPYRERLNNAVAALAAATANYDNAQINVSKLTPLVENNVISDVQLKAAQSSLQAARASIAQAKAMKGNAAIDLGYTLVTAPSDGYVGRIPLKTGSLVGVNTPTALTVISEIKNVYAYFSFSENDFLQFKDQFKGATVDEKINNMPAVELVLADNTVYAEKGKVETVLGQFSNTTGAISFRAKFPNPSNLLRSGNTGRVRIARTQEKTIVVPQEATFEVQDKIYVFTVNDSNKVASKAIDVAGKNTGYYFVDQGLNIGEKIVLSGAGNLKDGMTIVPQVVSTDSLLKSRPL